MTAQRTPEGKWIVFAKSTGERFERWPVDARAMLNTGSYVTSLAPATPAANDSGPDAGAASQDSTDSVGAPAAVVDPALDPAQVAAAPVDPVPHVTEAMKQNGAIGPTGAPLVIGGPGTATPAAPIKMPTGRAPRRGGDGPGF